MNVTYPCILALRTIISTVTDALTLIPDRYNVSLGGSIRGRSRFAPAGPPECLPRCNPAVHSPVIIPLTIAPESPQALLQCAIRVDRRPGARWGQHTEAPRRSAQRARAGGRTAVLAPPRRPRQSSPDRPRSFAPAHHRRRGRGGPRPPRSAGRCRGATARAGRRGGAARCREIGSGQQP